jgi:hypothetical protein
MLWLVLASSLVALTAALVVRGLGLDRGLERLLAVLLLAVSEIFVVSFTSALFSWYRPVPLVLLCGGLSAIALGVAVRWRAVMGWSPPRIHAEESVPLWRGVRGLLLVLLSGLCLVQLVWALVRALGLPPYGWDALWYHLVAVAQFVQSGSLGPSGLNPYADSYPRTGELLAAWPAVFSRSDALVPVAQVGFAVLGALATVGIARTVGVGGAGAWVAGTLYFLTPVVLAQASTAYVDVTFAGLQAVSLYFLMRALFTASTGASGSRAATARLVLAGLALGLALGTKPTALVWTAVSVVTVAVVRVVQRRGWRDSARAGAVVAGVAVAIGCPWYVLNTIRFGNPVYPVSVDIAGLHLSGLVSMGGLQSEPPVPGLWEPLQAVRSWLSDLALGVHGLRGFDYDQRQGGFGPVFPLVGIPATVMAAARALRHRDQPWLVLLAVVTAQFALQPYRWWSRFTIVLVVVAAVAIGAMLQRGVRFAGPVVVSALVAGCVLWSQPFLLLRVPRHRAGPARVRGPRGGDQDRGRGRALRQPSRRGTERCGGRRARLPVEPALRVRLPADCGAAGHLHTGERSRISSAERCRGLLRRHIARDTAREPQRVRGCDSAIAPASPARRLAPARRRAGVRGGPSAIVRSASSGAPVLRRPCRRLPRPPSAGRGRSGRQDDDPVVVGGELVTGVEGDLAGGHRHLLLARARFRALAGERAQRTDADRHLGEQGDVPDGAVDDDPAQPLSTPSLVMMSPVSAVFSEPPPSTTSGPPTPPSAWRRASAPPCAAG